MKPCPPNGLPNAEVTNGTLGFPTVPAPNFAAAGANFPVNMVISAPGSVPGMEWFSIASMGDEDAGPGIFAARVKLKRYLMTKKTAAKPTPAEVEILGILWTRGPSTVREIHERLGADRSIGYTGVLKLLQNMHAKGLVQRSQDGQAHVYEARESARMKRQLLGDLVQRVFAGSASQLVLHLLEDEKASPEEIEEIRQMLAHHRRRSK